MSCGTYCSFGRSSATNARCGRIRLFSVIYIHLDHEHKVFAVPIPYPYGIHQVGLRQQMPAEQSSIHCTSLVPSFLTTLTTLLPWKWVSFSHSASVNPSYCHWLSLSASQSTRWAIASYIVLFNASLLSCSWLLPSLSSWWAINKTPSPP